MSTRLAAALQDLVDDEDLPPSPEPLETQAERDARVVRIQITPGGATILVGQRLELTAEALDSNDVAVTGVSFTWRSESAGQAPQTLQDGSFVGEVAGTYTIVAEGASHTASITVNVVEPQSSPTTTPKESFQIDSREMEVETIASPDAPLLPGDGGWNGGNGGAADDPDNDRGNPAGHIEGNGNFQVVAPVISVPGRGSDLNLNLIYNSRLWTKAASSSGAAEMTFDIDKDNVAPGWSIGYGQLVNMGTAGAMLVEADGTRHSFTGNGGTFKDGNNFDVPYFKGQTTDGSMIEYRWEGDAFTDKIGYGFARYPDGTKVVFDNFRDNRILYPRWIISPNGNLINILHDWDTPTLVPRITKMVDSVGRTIEFHYDSNNLLTAITAPDFPDATGYDRRTLVRIHYKSLTLSGTNYGFDQSVRTVVRNQTMYVVDAIYYPSTKTGYWFGGDAYLPNGMLKRVVEQRQMNLTTVSQDRVQSLKEMGTVTQGQMTRQRDYTYLAAPSAGLKNAPSFGSMRETWWTSSGNQVADTAYEIDNVSSPRVSKITMPGGVVTKQLAYRIASTSSDAYKDGLVYQEELQNASGATLGKTEFTWEKGYLGGPRVSVVKTTDEKLQTKRTEYVYPLAGTTDAFDQILEERNYGYDGALIRKTVKKYLSYSNNDLDTRISFHIIYPRVLNLVTSEEVFDQNGQRVAFTKYNYDEYTAPRGTPLYAEMPDLVGFTGQYNPKPYPQGQGDIYVSKRGNLTSLIKYTKVPATGAVNYDSNPVTAYGPIEEKRTYDMTGNLLTASTSCCEKAQFVYDKNFQYAYVTSKTRGAPSDTTAQVTTKFNYHLGTGRELWSQDANGRYTQKTYFEESVRPKETILQTNARVVYAYDDVALKYTTSTYTAAAPTGILAGQSVQLLDGRQQVWRQETLASNGTDKDVVETKYDLLGRASQQSRPFRSGIASSAVLWTSTTYDDLGRVKKVTTPDGSITESFYNEATRPAVAGISAAHGQTVRVKNALGNERWTLSDADGLLLQVVEPDADGNGSITTGGYLTTYSYNGLGNLTQVNQGGQIRKFKYDSLGRLTHKKMAEAKATLNDTGQYVTAGGLWSDFFTYDERSNPTAHTDARGVKTLYDFDDPLNRLQSISYVVNASHDTSSAILPADKVVNTYMTTGDVSRIKTVTTKNASGVAVTTEAYNYYPATDAKFNGLLKDKTLTIQNRSAYPMVTSYTYDTLERIKDVTYPKQYGFGTAAKGKIVSPTYDQAGRISALSVADPGSTPKSYASGIKYNEAGQTTSLIVGSNGTNQTSDAFDYDPKTGLLTGQKVVRGTDPYSTTATKLLDLTYSYWKPGFTSGAQTGQLTRIINNLDAKKNRSYKYDPLGRLSEVTGGAQTWTQKYTYDQWGNRRTINLTGTMPVPQASEQGISQEEPPGGETTFVPPDEFATSSSSTDQLTPTTSGPEASDVPDIIEAETYNGGTSSYETTATSTGGETSYVRSTPEGTTLEYQLNIAVSDTYTIQAQVANNSGAGTFHIEIQEADNYSSPSTYNTGPMIAPSTGGETAFQPVAKEGAHLDAGHYVMRVVMDQEASFGMTASFDYFKIFPTAPAATRTAFDFDGDSKTDIATYRTATDTTPNWSILNSSTGHKKGERRWGTNGQYQDTTQNQDQAVAADYDGDGKTDTAVWTPSTGNWLIKPSSGATIVVQQFGAPDDVPVPADYDGDHKADIAVFRPSTSLWYIQKSSNGEVYSPQWGMATDIRLPADYDGDGKADLAVWRPSDSNWYIQQSSDGTMRVQQWGLADDVPVPADYDGDHKADIGVFRPSASMWYILKSSNGEMYSPQWGLATDKPVVGDYDGDGKADVAVFRATDSTGDWYVLRSSDGTFTQQQLGDNTVTPAASTAATNLRPIAEANGPYTKSAGGTVVFSSAGSRDQEPSGTIKYLWDFGDGTLKSTTPSPSHIYPYVGTYTAKLTVTDSGGLAASDTATVTITVPPTDGLPSLSYETATNRVVGFSYDTAGNQTRVARMDGTWQRYEYDAAGRLVNTKNDARTMTLQSITYGASNRRLMVQEGSNASTVRTYYVSGGDSTIAEYTETGTSVTMAWSKSYVYLGARLLATIKLTETTEAVQYHHPDRLGTKVITNPLNTGFEEQTTLPFGTVLKAETTTLAETTNRKFTSYERSTPTGLDYAVNRYYDPQQGRFTQVDPLSTGAASLTNPQTWNMYSYCANDPVNHVDPDGQFFGALFGFLANLLGSFINHVGFSFTYKNLPPVSFSVSTNFQSTYFGFAGYEVQITAPQNPTACEKYLANLFGDKGAYFADVEDGDAVDLTVIGGVNGGSRPPEGLERHVHLYGSQDDATKMTDVYIPAGGTILPLPRGARDDVSNPFVGRTLNGDATYMLVYFKQLGSLQDVTLAIFHIADFTRQRQKDGRTRVGTLGGIDEGGTWTFMGKNGGRTTGKHVHLDLWQGRHGSLPAREKRPSIRAKFSSICPENLR